MTRRGLICANERPMSTRLWRSINYYADFMADYLAVDRERIHVIPHGLNLEGHAIRETRRQG